MKKIIFIFLGILSIGLLLPNKVNAETNITNFEDTIKEEIKTFKGQSGTEEYIKKLESADLSNYKESDDKVNIYMFRGDTCSYCLKAVTYFSTIVDNYGDKFNLITYEVWKNSDNAKLMDEFAKTLGEEPNGVPYIIIGDKSFTGYSEEMNSQIESQINKVYKQTDRYDVMNNLDSGTTTIKEVKSNNTSSSSMVWLFILQIISILGLIIYVNKNNKNIKQKLEELEMKVNKNAKSKK